MKERIAMTIEESNEFGHFFDLNPTDQVSLIKDLFPGESSDSITIRSASEKILSLLAKSMNMAVDELKQSFVQKKTWRDNPIVTDGFPNMEAWFQSGDNSHLIQVTYVEGNDGKIVDLYIARIVLGQGEDLDILKNVREISSVKTSTDVNGRERTNEDDIYTGSVSLNQKNEPIFVGYNAEVADSNTTPRMYPQSGLTDARPNIASGHQPNAVAMAFTQLLRITHSNKYSLRE